MGNLCCSAYLEWEKQQERYAIQEKVNSHVIHEINNESVYVIGNNIHGELTVRWHEIDKLLNFTMLNREYITRIQSGHYCTFYTDKYYKNIFVSGNNQSFTCINDHPSIFNSSLDVITWFNHHNIKIKQICTNHVSLCTFWISIDNKIYVNGINHNGELGLGHRYNHQKQIFPVFIPELSKNINVIDIVSNPQYSLALCGTDKNMLISIIKYWSRSSMDISIDHDPIHAHDNNLCTYSSPPKKGKNINHNCILSKSPMNIHSDIIDLIQKFYEINTIHSTLSFEDGDIGKWHNDKWCKVSIFDDKQSHIIKISTGLKHSLILEDNGIIWCFGSNTFGELGIGDNTEFEEIYKPIQIPYFIQNKIKIIDIKCGSEHNLAISSTHKLFSWGLNASRQCGVGTVSFIYKPQQVIQLNEYEIISIECGHRHSYAKSKCGLNWLFGSNEYNECITYDKRKKIKDPHCINTIINELCGGKYVKSISLGYYNTKLILRNPKSNIKFGRRRSINIDSHHTNTNFYSDHESSITCNDSTETTITSGLTMTRSLPTTPSVQYNSNDGNDSDNANELTSFLSE